MKLLIGYLRKFIISFTSVFTCVILASTVFIGVYSNPYLPLRLIVQALIIAAVSALLNFIYHSEQPIHKKSLALRTCAHFSLLLLSVTGCAWFFRWFSFAHRAAVVMFFVLFAAVYAVIWLANFLGDLVDEKLLNLRLAQYQARPKE